ncbi:MAG: DMT family transporter [Clostridia bacterium]|nr:DMT family transporter [Clostridia bacterium]
MEQGIDQKEHRRASLALVLTTVLWGLGFIAVQRSIQAGIPSLWILAARFLCASVLIFGIFHRKILGATKQALIHGSIAGVMLFFGFLLQTEGQGRTTVASTAFLTSTNVLMVPFFVWLMMGRRPRASMFLLCLVTMVGVVLISMEDSLEVQMNLGDWMVLLSAMMFAMHIAYLDFGCSRDDPVQTAFFQMLVCGLISLLLALLRGEQITGDALRAGVWPVLYLGIFSSGVCYLLQTWGQTRVSAPEAGILLCLEGVFGSLFSWLFGMEQFRWTAGLGGLLVTASVMLSQRPEKKSE